MSVFLIKHIIHQNMLYLKMVETIKCINIRIRLLNQIKSNNSMVCYISKCIVTLKIYKTLICIDKIALLYGVQLSSFAFKNSILAIEPSFVQYPCELFQFAI